MTDRPGTKMRLNSRIHGTHRARQRRSDAGFSLVELMIAMIVLTVGLLGGMLLLIIGISINSRSRMDTSGTMLAQSVLEKILAQPYAATNTLTLTDCAGNSRNIATAAGGATLLSSTGDIDWTATTVPTNYSMYYDVCTNQGTLRYEVRWNIATSSSFSGRSVVVSAKNIGVQLNSSSSTYNAVLFALPITLKGVVGN